MGWVSGEGLVAPLPPPLRQAVEEVAAGEIVFAILVQGFLAHKKTHPPRTLPQAYAHGHRGVLGVWAFFKERGTPVPAEMHVLRRRMRL